MASISNSQLEREKVCSTSSVMPVGGTTVPPIGEDEDDDPAFCFFDTEVPFEMKTKDGKRQKLGLRFIDTEVIKVEPGSWANDRGVEKDDEIWSVNGKRFKGLSNEQKFRQLTQQRPFTISFKRPLYVDGYFDCDLDEERFGLRYGCLRSGKWLVIAVVPGGWGDKVGNRSLFDR